MPQSDSMLRAFASLLDATEPGDEWRIPTRLLGIAVGRGLLTLAEAEDLSRAALDDPQTITEAIAPRLEKAGLMSRQKVLEILGREPS